MVKKTDGRQVVKCENCVFFSQHEDIRFCLVLASFLNKNAPMPCEEEHFIRKNTKQDRYDSIVQAFEKLAGEK